jgi:hypothetical protein
VNSSLSDYSSDGPVILSQDRVYAQINSTLTAYRTNGTQVWQQYGIRALAPGVDGTLYGLSSDGFLTALSDQGTTLWQKILGTFVYGTALGDDDVLYVIMRGKSGNGSQLLALDMAQQGKELWRFEAAQSLYSAPVVGDQLLYLHTQTGQVLALQIASRGPALSPFARALGNNQNTSSLPQQPPSGVLRTFNGTLNNRHWTEQARSDFAAQHVRVESASGELLCSSLTDAKGAYRCTSRVPALEGFEAQYKVSGSWGEFTLNGTVVAGSSEVSQNLALPIKTLVLEGKLLGDADAPLEGQNVRVQGRANRDFDLSVATTADGTYRFTLVLPDAITQVTYSLSAAVNGNALETPRQTVTLPTGERVLQSQTLRLGLSGPGSTRWTASASTRGVAVAPNGTLYTSGSPDGYNQRVTARTSDGTVLWTFTRPGYEAVFSTPVRAASGVVYVLSRDGNLYALDATGQQAWFFQVGAPATGTVAPPAVAPDGTVYVEGGGKLYAISSSGEQVWQKTVTVSSPISLDAQGQLHFLSGTQLRVWSSAGEALSASEPDVTNWARSEVALNSSGIRFVPTIYPFAVRALDPTGDPLWSFTPDDYVTSPVLGSDGSVYVVSRTGVYALSSSGAQRWHTVLETNYANPEGALVASDGTVYAVLGKRLYALSAQGAVRWTFTAETELSAPPAMGPDGTLYVSDTAGKLYAVRSSSLGLAESAWPKAGRDPGNTAALPRSSAPTRTVRVSGQLSNRFWTDQPATTFKDLKVKLFQADGGFLCSATADEVGRYTCGGRTTTLGAFEVSALVQTSQSRSEVLGTVAAGNAETTTTASLDLPLSLTTVRVQGRVVDEANQGVADRQVEITSRVVNRTTRTAQDGRYQTALTELDGVLSEVYLSVQVDGEVRDLSTVAQSGEVIELVEDFQLLLSGPGSVVSRLTLEGYISSPPLMDSGGRTFLCANSGSIQVYASGVLTPWGPAQGVSCNGLMVTSERVYLKETGKISALSLEGNEQWSYSPTPLTPESYLHDFRMAQVGQGVYILVSFSDETRLVRLDSAGAVVWEKSITGYPVADPVVSPDQGITLALNERLLRYAEDGTQTLEVPLSGIRALALDASGPITLSDTAVQAWTLDGTLRWNHAGTDLRQVRIDASRVLVEDGDTLVVLNSEGALQSTITLPESYDRDWLIASNGQVLIHDFQRLYTLSTTGATLWTKPFSKYAGVSGLLVTPGGEAVFMRGVSSGGHAPPTYSLWRVRTDLAGLSTGPWPTSGYDNGSSNQQP